VERNIAIYFVCLSVCLIHAGIVVKPLGMKSGNFYKITAILILVFSYQIWNAYLVHSEMLSSVLH